MSYKRDPTVRYFYNSLIFKSSNTFLDSNLMTPSKDEKVNKESKKAVFSHCCLFDKNLLCEASVHSKSNRPSFK